jgi:multiple sugar transport system ATP-binding protein
MTKGHRIAMLNGGRLQQLGTPMELYQWPANLFLAQSIGSQAINLLVVVRHGKALGNDQQLTCRLRAGSHLVQVRVDPGERITPCQEVHLEVEPSGWRMFVGAGVALRP